MKTTRNRTSAKTIPTADQIAEMADAGENITRFFSGNGRMMQPLQRVNVDFTASMIEELDREARELNISRQAVIKTLLRRALDEQYVAAAARPGAMSNSLDGKHRDAVGRISEKHGNALAGPLRETYGHYVLSERRSDRPLEKVGEASGKSLGQLAKGTSSAVRGRSFGGSRSKTIA